MNKIRVMIVEDSRVVLELLKAIVQEDSRFELVAAVQEGEEALRKLGQVRPDVISLDIRLPGINGFDVTREVMAMRPTPIVVVSASVEKEDLKISMNALRAGALAVIDKPVGTSHQDYGKISNHIKTQLALMSKVKVVRQRFPIMNTPSRKNIIQVPRYDSSFQDPKVLGVVASTGGPNALVCLFQGLGEGFPLPILLVQHITPSFLKGFVTWLDGSCPFQVKIAESGEIPQPGTIYMPPVDRHLIIKEGELHFSAGPLVSSQRPSGTVLFQSMAQDLGSRAMGVLLTGMGDDGAQGLLEIRQRGGFTVAEDETTSVVFGMPKAAIQLGGACDIKPLLKIAPSLLETCEAIR